MAGKDKRISDGFTENRKEVLRGRRSVKIQSLDVKKTDQEKPAACTLLQQLMGTRMETGGVWREEGPAGGQRDFRQYLVISTTLMRMHHKCRSWTVFPQRITTTYYSPGLLKV
ncbi:hypothetical protein F7725_001693 [Dissostichus mawsoni]|uniref:Uncharacterized protein n=1 Tax=Dissostichus mawsoni TaxID=36200 RepID=A0A7J5Y0B7_DISMA|nr:hypothetical protein F7725_001693 [Dissostichus mawsoni]